MKVLFRISLILAILLPLAWFGFVFFMYGGCVFPIVTPLMAYIFCFFLLLAVSLSPLLALANLIAMILLWNRQGRWLFLPLMLFIIAFLAILPITWLAHSLCQKRFERHLPQYEQAVAEIEKSIIPGKEHVTPSGWMHLSILPPIAYREENGTLTIEFIVGGIGPPPRHRLYIYRSNGVIEKDSRTAKHWHKTTKVNDHWFRASD
jgi:hypothetical protein